MMLNLTAFVGLIGAIIMFSGDMLLYFTPEKFEMDGTLKPLSNIMKDLPEWRLKLGGLLGPIAAFFYCIGFINMYLVTTPESKYLGFAITLFAAFGIILGGAYHSHFTYIGLVAKTNNEEALDVICENTSMLSRISLISLAISAVLFAALIVFGKTVYPKWFVVLSPAVTIFLSFLWLKLPQPLQTVLLGGWYNLIYVIYFASSLFF